MDGRARSSFILDLPLLTPFPGTSVTITLLPTYYSSLLNTCHSLLHVCRICCSIIRRVVRRVSGGVVLLLPSPTGRRSVRGVRLQPLPMRRHKGLRNGRSLGGGAAALHRRRNEAATAQEIHRERGRLVIHTIHEAAMLNRKRGMDCKYGQLH